MSRSIQQLPNNSGTTSVTEVYTSTGFNAGDPVYFQNGDYKSPANLTAPSSVGFSFANSSPYNPYGEGGSLYPAFSYAQMQTAGISGGSVRRFAAVLTNGNIVQVWTNHANSTVNTQRPYFRIISTSGTVVVSPTVISTTYSLDYTAISVVALTGGGFAVGWINNAGGTANSVNYAIYSNTGSVVTSATQDTSFSTGGSGAVPIEMTSLANGGFAIAIKNASAVVFVRAYSSTGVGAYSTINTGFTAQASNRSFGFVSRSDSSVCFIDTINGTTYTYAIYSSTGTTIVALSSFTVTSTTLQSGPDASVLSDGTTIVFAYYATGTGSAVYPALRFLPTGNVLGSEIIGIPIANLFANFSYAGYYIGVLGITGNNVMLFFSDGFGYMQYAFYNSSGTCISGSNATGAIPLQIPGGFAGQGNRITLLESSGSVFAYWNYATNSQVPVQQICAKISTSTYLIVPVLSTAGAPTLVTGQPTGTLALSGVTPVGPSYYSTSSSSTVVTNTPATVLGPTALASSNIDSIASCSLPNGNVVVVYRVATGRPVTAKVLSSTGAVLSTISVTTTASSSAVIYGVKVAALSGGGFVVMFCGSTSTAAYTLQVYSSAYELTATTTFTASIAYGLNYNFDMCGLLNNNFAIFYNNDGSSGFARVYNSALSNIYSYTVSGNPQGMSIAGNSWGGFAISFFSSSGNFRSFVPTGTSTWVNGSAFTFSMGAYVQNPQMVATQSGMYVITGYNAAYPSYGMMTDAGSSTNTYTGSLTSWPVGSASNPTSYPMMGIGLTGNGNVVFATSHGTTFGLGVGTMAPQVTWSQGQQVPYQQAGTNNLGAMFSNSAYNTTNIVVGLEAQPRVTPLVGNNCLITFRDVSGYPAYIIVNGNSYSSVYTVTASTTISSPVPVVPATVSGVISGTFAGVAVTSATAGSTGQLVTNGQALLGTSYTSTATGAFDSTGGAVGGLKGTFNGRSVNLQGNS